MGSTLLDRQDFAQAADAFWAAVDAAQRAELAPLRIEALGMAGACLLRLAREDAALVAWTEAVNVGVVDGGECSARTVEDVGRALVAVLAREGLHGPADLVRELVGTRRDGSR